MVIHPDSHSVSDTADWVSIIHGIIHLRSFTAVSIMEVITEDIMADMVVTTVVTTVATVIRIIVKFRQMKKASLTVIAVLWPATVIRTAAREGV